MAQIIHTRNGQMATNLNWRMALGGVRERQEKEYTEGLTRRTREESVSVEIK